MKKITLLAAACALFMSQNVAAQGTQEIQYVEDATQGYVINSFGDNWFITAQGGANVYFSKYDKERKFGDRFAPNAALYLGKWFTPVWGARIGVDYLANKSLSKADVVGAIPEMCGSYFKNKVNHIGPTFDLMANLTNLFCGYHPGRVYNLTLYAGAGDYWTLAKEPQLDGTTGATTSKKKDDGYHNTHDNVLTLRAGLINSFNVSKQVQLFLDLRASSMNGHGERANGLNSTVLDVQAYLGLTYLFKDREWHAPVVPICPEPENCDALRARLAAADARIADLEAQLRDCLNRPTAVKEAAAQAAPLATIYYPIGVYRLTREDNNVLGAIAHVMKDNSNTHYVLTGWADNYTGTDAINVRLRHNRVNGVYNKLIKCGVPASQLTATINNGNLCDLGEKYVALDRAVTIEEGN